MTKKIAFANTLKSVDDVRTFEKLAQTIAKTNKYEVNIIGNDGKKASNNKSIHFHPFSIERKSITRRLSIRNKILRKLIRLNPDVLIIGTHELLLSAWVLKVLKGTSIIYDVRENYKMNLVHLSKFPFVIRLILGNIVRLKEVIFARYVDQFWLAENCYHNELRFSQKSNVILENKALSPALKQEKKPEISLLFSGSISHYSEVLQAVKCYQKMKEIKSQISLKIIGQYHDENLAKQLIKIAKNDKQVTLHISSNPISHSAILREISNASLGIISYQENTVNTNKKPTKLYEYSRHLLPFLIQENTKWAVKGKELGGAISIDFSSPDITYIFDQLNQSALLFPKVYPPRETWESQESKIIHCIENLIPRD